MATTHLATYLNDHLAGSVAAIDLMERIERKHAGDPIGAVVARVRADVIADRQELESIIARLHLAQSAPRKAVAWLGERVAQLKLALDDPSDGALRLFESLEAIALGLEGKNALWHALAATAPEVPALQGVGYDQLIARGHDQRSAIEPARLDAARAAFVEP